MSALQMQIDNCTESGNTEWLERSRAKLKQLARDFLPSGSGIDTGTFVREISDDKIVMECGFHHMTDNGYDGWTEHRITARRGFYLGITIQVSGRDRNEVKDHLAEVYQYALSRTVEWSEEKQRFMEVSDDE